MAANIPFNFTVGEKRCLPVNMSFPRPHRESSRFGALITNSLPR